MFQCFNVASIYWFEKLFDLYEHYKNEIVNEKIEIKCASPRIYEYITFLCILYHIYTIHYILYIKYAITFPGRCVSTNLSSSAVIQPGGNQNILSSNHFWISIFFCFLFSIGLKYTHMLLHILFVSIWIKKHVYQHITTFIVLAEHTERFFQFILGVGVTNWSRQNI